MKSIFKIMLFFILNNQLKTIAFKTIVYLWSILLFSCNNSKEIHVISLDRIDQSVNLDLNEILTDISILQLSDNFLHSVNDKIYVTPHYLILYRNKFSKNASLDLFNREGEYVKNLAVRGNGPGEFNMIDNFFVDKEEKILYYTDTRSRSQLNRINISKGVELEPLQIDFNYLTMTFINDKVYSFPNIRGYFQISDYPDSAIVFRSTSIPLGEVEDYKGAHNYSFTLLGSTIVSYKDEILLMNLGYSDTLFNLTNNELRPICVLHFSNKMSNHIKGGSLYHLISAYNNGIVLAKVNVDFRPPMTVIYKNEFFMLYSRNGKIFKIISVKLNDDIIIDITEPQDYPHLSLPIICGEYGYMILESDDLKNKLFHESDNDNPLIIIGKLQ